MVRVWELPPEPLLRGPLALLPLAPISAVTEGALPGIIQQMKQRLAGRGDRKQAPLLGASAYILLGLRYSPEVSAQLFQGVVSMEESSTYQAILAEGREEGRGEGVAVARKMLRVAGEREFGSSDTAIIDALDAITDLAQLEALCQRLRTASSWQELLAAPAPRRRRRRPAP